ncbi:alpha/beta hydrolase [Lacticaseibacillus paracasei]|uniref:alpha/beta hydrolase n=1 Tax=Lacticaseibacillus paracasei TaxID=1597 RepID=UPI0021B060CC|nr:alpha/beta hydrolase [Lacticaseibacillus paracasei]UWY25225.1 alpha/beta hydrolase [Lacticaseibacillus paracasei]
MAKSAKRWLRVSISVLVILLLASGGYWLWWQLGSRAIHQQTYRHTGIVTVFVPGYGSNSLTFGPMVQRFKQDKASDQVTTIHVSADGKRTITGADRYNGKNPLINVVFADAKSPQKEVRQLTDLLHWLRVQRHVTRVNLVGHSMGSNLSFNYMTTPHANLQPQVINYVSFASEFYRDPTAQIRALPKTLHILVIGGQVFGAKGDWAVSLAGVKRLAAKFKAAGLSTTLFVYTGTPVGAYHSTLHQNPYVDAEILHFLFT